MNYLLKFAKPDGDFAWFTVYVTEDDANVYAMANAIEDRTGYTFLPFDITVL